MALAETGPALKVTATRAGLRLLSPLEGDRGVIRPGPPPPKETVGHAGTTLVGETYDNGGGDGPRNVAAIEVPAASDGVAHPVTPTGRSLPPCKSPAQLGQPKGDIGLRGDTPFLVADDTVHVARHASDSSDVWANLAERGQTL